MPTSETVAAMLLILATLAKHDDEIAAFARGLINGHHDAQRQLETALPIVSESEKAEAKILAELAGK